MNLIPGPRTGGNGSIRFYDTTLSLVIRQTHKVHEEIRDLLEQLRRLQDVQVSLEFRTIEAEQLADRALLEKLRLGHRVVLVPPKAAALIRVGSKRQDREAQPASQGHAVQWADAEPAQPDRLGGVDFSPVSSADRRFVRLSINAKAGEKQAINSLLTLKAGQSVLLDTKKLTGSESKTRTLLLVTPKIVVEEEEEELLGTGK